MGIWEQLGLDMARHRMVALVGAGGKTSTLYALARQAADSGRTVVVTTTTHILRHPGLPLVEEPTPERLRAALAEHGVVTVGTVFRGDKLSGAGTPEELRRAADVVLVEADGAKRLPLKAPAEYEPVIPPAPTPWPPWRAWTRWDRPWGRSATGLSGCAPCWARGRSTCSPPRTWPFCWPAPRGGGRA